mmetsp:Transcript_21554/g.31332  ORF Transcript_21554/g.31332 Transcript_21554/m.31332 type:complete len:334 (+) Transcript_21554:74-1075(+)
MWWLVIISCLSSAVVSGLHHSLRYGTISSECRSYFTSTDHLTQLVYDAAREIDREPPLSSSLSSFLSYFYHNYNGYWLFDIANSSVIYTQVHKCNSDNIIYSLYNAEVADRMFSYCNHSCIKKTHKYHSLVKLRETLRQRNINVADVKSFTFVRNPFSRFISGVIESHYRSTELNLIRFAQTEEEMQRVYRVVNSTTNISAILEELVYNLSHGNIQFVLSSFRDPEHFVSMSYMFTLWKQSYIGFVDSFEVDWTEMQKALELSIRYDNVHRHTTSIDPFKIKPAFSDLFESRPEYMRAICRLLAVDFVCLQVQMPRQCTGILDYTSWKYIPYL